MQLSTPKNSPYYRFDGDFCHENSGRLLCDILGVCGDWECDLEDFMCPSHEFRRNFFLGYGLGDCSAANRAVGIPDAIALASAASVCLFLGLGLRLLD